MIPPIFRILLTRPALLGDHVVGYAQLAKAETREVVTAWRDRAVLWAAAAALGLLAVIFLGVALIAFAAIPQGSAPSHGWLLWVVPLVPAAAAVGAFMAAKGGATTKPYAGLRAQIDADQELIHKLAGGEA